MGDKEAVAWSLYALGGMCAVACAYVVGGQGAALGWAAGAFIVAAIARIWPA